MKKDGMNEKKMNMDIDKSSNNSINPDEIQFPPSWADQIIGWARRSPLPPWLFYLCLFFILTFFIQVGYWIDGFSLVDMSVNPLVFHITAVYPVIILAAIHFLDNTACHSFEDFKPALGKNTMETHQLLYKLITIPSRPGWIVGLIGGIFGLCLIFFADYSWFFDFSPVAFCIVLSISILGFALTAVMLYHTIRQLKHVSYIHSIATQINLLHYTPLYAFSRLSAFTGLFFITLMYFDLVANSETLNNPALVVLNFLVLPLIALACFILPIVGMHRKLVQEKRNLHWEVNQRLEKCLNHLYKNVDTFNLQNSDSLNTTINTLITTRDLIAKISTWPWQPQTSGLFFSALTLPIVVFLIQTLIKNVLGF